MTGRSIPSALFSGLKVSALTLVEQVRVPGRKGCSWRCSCDCGNECVVYNGHLRSGAVKGCGCQRKTNNLRHGMSHTPEYRAWDNARSRCSNPKNKKYDLYGGRGIRVCARWVSSFENFLADLGRRPGRGYSLERLDSDGHYEPKNCIWATAVQQNNNRSSNRHLIVNGEWLTVAQASRATGIPHATILSRLDAGKTDGEAVRYG